MLNKLKRNQGGFTIIEVMIVLAIAGLIILIVLLAVPALQRTSRNTGIKSDASAIAGGVTEYQSNNDGSVPGFADKAASSSSVKLCNGSTSCPATPTDNPVTAKVQANTVIDSATLSGATASITPVAGHIAVEFKAKCPDTVGGASVAVTGNPRSTAIVYPVEGSGSAVNAKCIDS